MAKQDKQEPNQHTSARQAHHQADEAEKQQTRVIALKTEMLLGPVLSFVVGIVTIGGFLAYIGSDLGTIIIGGLIAGAVMAVGTIALGGV
jgi:hypothetical protein